jgi:hypothetical protein
VIRCGEPGCGKPIVGEERPLRQGETETWGGPCRKCRGKRGAAAMRRTLAIHHRGFKGAKGRTLP